MSDKPKTTTEKAEEYVRQETIDESIEYRLEEAYLAGHAEGRREALAMAQGLVDALGDVVRHLDFFEYVAKRYKEVGKEKIAFDKLPEVRAAHKSAIEALAKFEEWKDGK